MSRDKADVEFLANLHALLADDFLELLTKGRLVEVKDRETGEVEVVRMKPDAATYNQIRQFLKDNHIDTAPGKSKKLLNIAAALPFGDDEELPGDPKGMH